MPENFDFIIIGGGSAGSVLANRLSANPDNKVLVLEAGGTDHRIDFRLHMPAALTYPLTSKTYNWWYESEPEPYMYGRKIYHPRGKLLGGTSSINGMIYIRGNPLDFEKWAANPGLENWSWANCLPYFKRIEYRLSGADEYQGVGGPQYLTTPKCENPLFDAFFKAVQEVGYPLTKNVNGFQQEGFAKFDATIYRGRRWNAARAFLHPIASRRNLEIYTHSLVNNIIFSRKKAVGVNYLKNNRNYIARGNKIILCGGAFNSPQILQLSGIGDAKYLESVGIKPFHHLPGVGQNLQDHLELYVQYDCIKPVSLFPEMQLKRAPFIGAEWLFNSTGTGASNHFEAGGFIRSNEKVLYPNLQFHFLPVAVRYNGASPHGGHGFQLHVGPMNTDVRGSVNVVSNDPRTYPKIKFNYLSTAQERREWIEAIHCSRKIIASPAFDEFRGREISPGPEVLSDEAILDFVSREGESAYHPCSTARMGLDNMSVVDAELNVHGLENLQVVDASIMPSITNGNIYSPVLMIAEKASDIILGNSPLMPSFEPFYRHSKTAKLQANSIPADL